MPSGKTHDAITLILGAPVFGAALVATESYWLATLATAGFLFGGFMFGPDLDTVSNQYSRWKILKLLWFPYRTFFKHRSRWSHGLLFGTFLRVVYFMGVATCLAFVIAILYASLAGSSSPGIWDFTSVWRTVRGYSDSILGAYGLLGLFVGMWVGAASHTLADLAISYVRTGRRRL